MNACRPPCLSLSLLSNSLSILWLPFHLLIASLPPTHLIPSSPTADCTIPFGLEVLSVLGLPWGRNELTGRVALLPQLFEDGIERGNRGTKFALVGVSREILLRLPKAQERQEGKQAGARIGSASCSLG